MKLDIGGGHSPEPGYLNIDPVHGQGEYKRRIEDGPLPFADGTIEAIRASHVLEHVLVQHRIGVMNECHRVLQPGGELTVIVPLFPTWQAIADPTHVSWWVQASFAYFTGQLVAQADYGIRYWTEISYSAEEYDGAIGTWKGTPR